MATTTLMPLDPAISPQRVTRILTISADLLPEEMVLGRRSRRSRTFVAVAVVVAVVLLGVWYAAALHSVSSNESDLGAATKVATDLSKQQRSHQRVVTVQNQTTAMTKQLSELMASDLSWTKLVNRLRSTGVDSGVTVTGINASLNKANSSNSADSLPSASTAKAIGSVTVTGGAPDKPTMAAYVKNLGGVTGLANPYLTTATQSDDGVWSFSITVDITTVNLCGRFTSKCTSGGN